MDDFEGKAKDLISKFGYIGAIMCIDEILNLPINEWVDSADLASFGCWEKIRQVVVDMFNNDPITRTERYTKLRAWVEDYTDIGYPNFRDNYHKCERCGMYTNEQCICYAR